MEKAIDYLEELRLYLWSLSRLCVSLSCAQNSASRPTAETVSASYDALCRVLESKVNEIDAVVSEYYEA